MYAVIIASHPLNSIPSITNHHPPIHSATHSTTHRFIHPTLLTHPSILIPIKPSIKICPFIIHPSDHKSPPIQFSTYTSTHLSIHFDTHQIIQHYPSCHPSNYPSILPIAHPPKSIQSFQTIHQNQSIQPSIIHSSDHIYPQSSIFLPTHPAIYPHTHPPKSIDPTIHRANQIHSYIHSDIHQIIHQNLFIQPSTHPSHSIPIHPLLYLLINLDTHPTIHQNHPIFPSI